MLIERHIFGSYSGYTTLGASPGIAAGDCRLLEGGNYGFGQTDDRGYLNSLRDNPAYFTRSLSGGRRGLTRVLAGDPDDNGRPTLRMVTAVVSRQDWDDILQGDVQLLLEDPSLWNVDPGSSVEAVSRVYTPGLPAISSGAAARVVALISEIERSDGAQVVVDSSEFGLAELCAVEMLIPPNIRPRFSSAYRSLSSKLSVSLNCVAEEAPNANITYHFDARTEASPYADYLIQNGLSSRRLPLDAVSSYRLFGQTPQTQSVASKPLYIPPPPPRRRMRKVLIVGIVLSLLLFGVSAMLLVRSWKTVATTMPTTAPAEDIPPLSPTTAPATNSIVPSTTFVTGATTQPVVAPSDTRPSPPVDHVEPGPAHTTESATERSISGGPDASMETTPIQAGKNVRATSRPVVTDSNQSSHPTTAPSLPTIAAVAVTSPTTHTTAIPIDRLNHAIQRARDTIALIRKEGSIRQTDEGSIKEVQLAWTEFGTSDEGKIELVSSNALKIWYSKEYPLVSELGEIIDRTVELRSTVFDIRRTKDRQAMLDAAKKRADALEEKLATAQKNYGFRELRYPALTAVHRDLKEISPK